MGRLGELTYLRAGTIVIVAVAILAAALPLSAGIFDKVEPFDISDPDSEVQRAYAAYEASEGVAADPQVVLLADTGSAEAAATTLASVEGIALVRGPDESPALVSRDGSSALVLGFTESGTNRVEVGENVAGAFPEEEGVLAGGTAVAAYEIGEQTESDTRRIELFAAPVLLLVLLLVFRSPVAAALPLILSGFSIIVTLALLSLLAGTVDIDIFSLQVVTGLGVGLAIDYSLFVLARYRIEMRRDRGYRAAHLVTTVTAGRAVLFGALTVAAALAALIAFPHQFLSSTGLAGAFVAILSGLGALFVLPALLALLGPRVDPGWERAENRASPEPDPLSGGSRFWTRLSERVMAHPFPWATAGLLAMLAVAAPTLGGSVTTPDARALPESAGARQVADRATTEFDAGNDTRLGVWLPEGSSEAAAVAASDELTETWQEAGIQVEAPRELADGSSYVALAAPVDPLSDEGQQLVKDARDAPFPDGALVGGRAAELTDQRTSIADHALLVVAIVVLTNLVLVLAMVRSVVLPLISILLNALTVLAAYGLMVAAFQSEAIANLLGTGAQDGIDVSVPLLAFAVVFGLSTDYGIFVLSRILEARRSGLSDAAAITAGIARTGRLITSAAVIFAIAVGANVFSDLVIVKEFALAVAIAVILDATVVRGILVPSILRLLGGRAWWPGDRVGA